MQKYSLKKCIWAVHMITKMDISAYHLHLQKNKILSASEGFALDQWGPMDQLGSMASDLH